MKSCLLMILFALTVAAQRPAPSGAGMSRIPAATFEMGTDEREIPELMVRFNVKRAKLFQEETPQHTVRLASFLLDKTEVTNLAFKRFVDKFPQWQKERIPRSLHNGTYLQHWVGGAFPADKKNHPVVYVTWHAAAAYCRSLGKRLPTEAEWEYAARGGLKDKDFPWGDETPDKTRANYSASGFGAPIKVASYPPNGYWLYDMVGNVWEFLADEWTTYPGTPGSVNESAADDFLQVKTRRALRGGSFGGSVINLRVTYRDSHSPENAVEHVGFRCAADVR